LAATAPRRPPCAHPICARRSPIFTLAIPVTSAYGSLLRREGIINRR
jgi:hypothetical protein